MDVEFTNDVIPFFNNCKLPIGVSFNGWREIFTRDAVMKYGYFYIGIIDGYNIWRYINDNGLIVEHEEKSKGVFHFLNQLKVYHPQRVGLNGKVKEGFKFV